MSDDDFLVLTPFGSATVQFPEEGPIAISGESAAQDLVRGVLLRMTNTTGMAVTLETATDLDLMAAASQPGADFTVMPPAWYSDIDEDNPSPGPEEPPSDELRPVLDSAADVIAALRVKMAAAESAVDRLAVARAIVALRASIGADGLPADPDAAWAAMLASAQGDARAAGKAYLKLLQGHEVQTVIGPVRITGKTSEKMRSGLGSSELKAALIPRVPAILQGDYLGSNDSPKVRPDGMTVFHYFAKTLKVGDLEVTAGVSVGERAQTGSKILTAYELVTEMYGKWAERNKGAPLNPGQLTRGGAPSAASKLDGAASMPAEAEQDNDGAEGLNIVILQVLDANGAPVPGMADVPAAAPPPPAARFAVGAALSRAERKAVLETLVDVYKAKGAPREFKGIGRDGNERFGYVYSPELFERSDITGVPVRYYVTLPDKRIAHPSELFPDYTQSDIDAEMQRREYAERADADEQKRAEERYAKATADSAPAARDEFLKRNPNFTVKDWRTGKVHEFIYFTKGGKFYATTSDDEGQKRRLLRAGWQQFVPAPAAPARTARQIAEAIAKADPGGDVLALREKARQAIVAELGPQAAAALADTGNWLIGDDLTQAIHDGQYAALRDFAAGLPVPVLEDDIPMDAAVRAYSGTSHSPERRGASARRGYVRSLVAAWKQGVAAAGSDPEALARVTEAFKDVAAGYRSRTLAALASMSSVVSTNIAGPANFPLRAMEKRRDSSDRRAKDASDYLESGIARMLKAARAPVDNSPQGELQRIQANIAEREKAQERMKTANVALRRGDDAALAELGFSEADIAKLKRPDFAGNVGFPAWQMSNNNAEIRRLRERLASADARVQAAASAPVEREVNGVRIEENAQDDRLRLYFEGKPADAVRTDLKANGFKWSPTAGAWQRQLTDNARRAAKLIISKHFTPASEA